MLSSLASYGDRYHHDMDGPLSMAITRSARRGPWLPEEDNTLLQLVRTQGANNWVRISQQLQHRSPKQCRERYHQNLKPSLKHDPISAQEGEVIEQLVQEMGKRWAEIARRLGNRSDNAVKNWWNGSVNRRRRNPSQPTAGLKQVGNRLQPIPFSLPLEGSYTTYSRQHLEKIENKNDNIINLQSQHTTSRHQSHLSLHTSGLYNPRNCSSSDSPMTFPLSNFVSSQGRTLPPSTSSTTTPRLSLPRVQPPEIRPELPPLRSPSFHVLPGDRPNLLVERPPISPALSETSQWQPPSLISDNQSSHSISPRTVTTPRPGIPAPVEIGQPVWSDTQNTTQHTSYFTSYKTSHQAKSYHRQASLSDPADNRLSASFSNEERSKDLRMNVSTLLQ